MAVESATERAVFFSTDDFGTSSSYTKAGGSAVTVKGIFDNEFLEVDPMTGVGVVSAQPRFVCASSSLPTGSASGDAITISSTSYLVKVIQDDGVGVTTLVLEKQ